MDLDQRIHAELPRLGNEGLSSSIIEHRQHDKDCVRSGNSSLGDLAKVEEEILGQDRAVEMPPR
jgi:hypothetical protein